MSFLMENWQNLELAAIRVGFGEGLVDIAKKNNLVVALSADLMESVGFGKFYEEIGSPRAIEVGVAEQNLVTVASGLAAMGNIPFAASYAAFSPGRNWEQIRTTICLNNQPVKLVGSHAGLNVGPDGATHQMLEDIALMRSLVHKSQGLTFKNVNIDFTGGVFAGGQAYVALSRCTSLEGITLKEPLRRNEVFVRSEVTQFAKHYNDNNIISTALKQSKADKEYYDAISAFNEGDFDSFLSNFFLAIHSRYDIERPAAKRFIRRKLNIINQLRDEIETLKKEQAEKDKYLKELSVEYVMMGKECEQEAMTDAAIANYEKALRLCPNNPTARKRLEKLKPLCKKL